MKHFVLLAVLGAATMMHAQSLPDCRTPSLPAHTKCTFEGTTLPTQQSLGDITLPSSDHVHMTEPFVIGADAHVAPSVNPRMGVGGMFTVQSETLGYKGLVSAGFKGFANKQWSNLRGVEVRGTAVEFGLGDVGFLSGNNHTVAVAVGPRIQYSFGRVTPYGEALVGFLHQYYYGLSESGVFGATVRLNQHLALVPADVEYRYASLQDSTVTANPRRGRIELSSGVVYKFGR